MGESCFEMRKIRTWEAFHMSGILVLISLILMFLTWLTTRVQILEESICQ